MSRDHNYYNQNKKKSKQLIFLTKNIANNNHKYQKNFFIANNHYL